MAGLLISSKNGHLTGFQSFQDIHANNSVISESGVGMPFIRVKGLLWNQTITVNL